MEQQKIRAVCYARFPNEEPTISEEQLIGFCSRAAERWVESIEKAYIDTSEAGPICNSPQWEQLVKDCTTEGITLVVIPALSMITISARQVRSWAEKLKRQNGLDCYFLLESIYTKSEDAVDHFEVEDLMQSLAESRREQKKKLRKLFSDLNKSEPCKKMKERNS